MTLEQTSRGRRRHTRRNEKTSRRTKLYPRGAVTRLRASLSVKSSAAGWRRLHNTPEHPPPHPPQPPSSEIPGNGRAPASAPAHSIVGRPRPCA